MLKLRTLAQVLMIAGLMTYGSSTETPAQSTDATPSQRHITVTASGSVSAVPDMVVISSGVQTSAETARDALTENSDIMRRVIKRLKEVGIRGAGYCHRQPVRSAGVPTLPRQHKATTGHRLSSEQFRAHTGE